MLELKERSKLRINPEYKIPNKDLRGFLKIYQSSNKLNPILFGRLWVSSIFPEITKEKGWGRAGKAYLRKVSRDMLKQAQTLRLHLVRVNDGFLVTLPILSNCSRGQLSKFALIGYRDVKNLGKIKDKPEDDSESDTDLEDEEEVPGLVDEDTIDKSPEPPRILEVVAKKYKVDEVLNNADILPKLKQLLKECLVSLNVEGDDNSFNVSLTFKVSKIEAEYLMNGPWNLIRPFDVYSIFLNWANTYYGVNSKNPPPLTAFPISNIAASLPSDNKKLTIKVNEDGLCVDSTGHIHFLPKKLDNTRRYEDLYNQAGVNEDGSFSVISNGVKRNLPSNIAVLIDWVNCKFSYTNTNGLLSVQDVSRFLPANASHVHTLLTRRRDFSNSVRLAVRLMEAAGIEPKIDLKEEDLGFLDPDTGAWRSLHKEYKDILITAAVNYNDYIDYAVKTYKELNQEIWPNLNDVTVNSEFGPFRPIAKLFNNKTDVVLSRLDNVYEKYSVLTTTDILPYIILIDKYADNAAAIKASADTLNNAALNQGEDPEWAAPALPLMNPDIGTLPHQAKIRNLLRDSPPFAILPVQAGGGKSLLAIMDVITEFKANRSFPYLIFCPGHLVSNYVKEIAYFTKGQLNCVPLNSYIIRKHGFDRLSAIIQNMPRNSVVVASFDVLKLKAHQICYGTTSVVQFPVTEFIKQFGFQYVLLDESHYVKNDSARSKAVLSSICDIPKKRLASGTMSYDSPSDLAMQIAMMDPTLFGSRDDFNARFGSKVKGGRIIEWKKGGEAEAMRMIKSRVVVAGAMRKEWAALLPHARERLIKIDLTEEQRRVYDILMNEVKGEIENNEKVVKKLQELQKKAAESPEENDDIESSIEDILRPYLTRIEQFLTAPNLDKLGNIELRGLDRISPKVNKIEEIIREHLAAKIPGKILIFTGYVGAGANELYDALAPDIKKITLLYSAENKEEDGSKFEKDDRIRVMIGAEFSMNTGLNFQFVSRMIRVNAPWNPGALEQGESRINRPQLKKKEDREDIYYDWLICNRTIDVTKVSRLISKIISVAKFDNAEDEAYQEIPDVPIVKMSLENVFEQNDWSTTMREYAESFADYKRVQIEDYDAYKEEFVKKYGDNFLIPIKQSKAPPDAEVMYEVPYTPGLELTNQDKLGLVRLDEALGKTEISEDDEDTDIEDSEGGESDEFRAFDGKAVHTEFGDGTIIKVLKNPRLTSVRFPNGGRVTLRTSTIFLINKKFEKTSDIRSEVINNGLPVNKLDIPEAPSIKIKKSYVKEIQKEKKVREEENLIAELSVTVTNGFLGLVYFIEEESNVLKALEAQGFRPTPDFYYAEMKTAKMLYKQIMLWNDKGFEPDPKMNNEMSAINTMYQLLKTGKIKSSIANFKFANVNQLRNFYRMEIKPSSDKMIIRPYPIIEDGIAYLALPIRGQVGTKNAIKTRATGVRFYHSEPSLTFYGLKREALEKKVKDLVNQGISITNLTEIKRRLRKLSRSRVRDSGELEL